MNVLDLFSGIGGFSLGLERAGMRTVAFCEIEPFCRRVLAKHWPDVPCYDDVRSLTADRLGADGIAADVVCGGFPCQDISVAGKGAGLGGERSGLWAEICRLIRELRPKYAIVENVSGLLAGPPEQPGGWFGRVLGDLAEIGFDAEWHCIPASAVGAPHRRDRVWIIAYPGQVRRNAWRPEQSLQGTWLVSKTSLANATCFGRAQDDFDVEGATGGGEPTGQFAGSGASGNGQWVTEPRLDRVAYGVPNRVDRIGALGNAVVPLIPEIIGRAIMSRSDG